MSSWDRLFEALIRRNAQCEAVRRRIPLSLGLHAQKAYNIDGDRVKTGDLRGVVVTSRFRGPNSAKYAMRGSPPPHPARLGSPLAKYAPLWTVSAPNQGIYDVLARKSPRRGPNLAKAQCEAVQRRVPLSPGLTHQNISLSKVKVSKEGIFEASL